MKERIGLVPRNGVYLTSHGYGDDERFATVFRATWKRIPYRDRRRILRYWREINPFKNMDGAPAFPHLVILPHVNGRNENAFATTGLKGAEIQFLARATQEMPEECLAQVIAHELCHVLLRSYPDIWPMPKNDDEIGEEIEENAVQESLMEWGFDVEAWYEWCESCDTSDWWEESPG